MNQAEEDALVEQAMKSEPVPYAIATGIRLAIRAAVAQERERAAKWVADDAFAMTFQTEGQYRAALIAAIRRGE